MTGYNVKYSKQAVKDLKKLDKYTQRMLLVWIEKNLIGCENPRTFGKGLTANRAGQCATESEIIALSVTFKTRNLLF